MRPKLKVIESPALSRLLFLIVNNYNYAQLISNKTGNQPSPIVKQLKRLEKEGFVTFREEKLLNKKIYSIVWPKIIEEFFFMIGEREKQFTSEGIGFFGHEGYNVFIKGFSDNVYISLFNLKKSPDKDYINRMRENPYLRILLNQIFITLSNNTKEITLREVFNKLLNRPEFLDYTHPVPSHQHFKDYSNMIACLKMISIPLIITPAIGLAKDEFKKEIEKKK